MQRQPDFNAKILRRLVFFGSVAAVLVGLACSPPESGSSDDGVQKPGQQERGRSGGQVDDVKKDATGQWQYTLSYADIVLAPDGHTLLVGVPQPGPSASVAHPTLQLVAYDLDTAKQTVLAAQDVVRIQFSVDGKLAWLLTDHGTALKRLEIATGNVALVRKLETTFTTLDRSPDGKLVVLANLPRSDWDELTFQGAVCKVSVQAEGQVATVDRCRVQVVPLDQPGATQTWVTPLPVRDLDFSPFRQEVLLTWSKFVGAAPQATVAFYQPGLPDAVTQVTAPNCGDELVLDPQTGRAFLAPSRCQKDPISVFDLDQRVFVKNLPGFGPVAVVGGQAIGFVRAGDLLAWGETLQTPYGLIAVDTQTLAWQVHPWGDSAPVFTAAPDGQHLLVWQADWYDTVYGMVFAPTKLTRIRVADWQQTPMQNPTVRPRSFAWRSDGDTMLALSDGWLFALRVSDASVQYLPLSFAPELLQLRPNGEVLLAESDQPRFYRYDVISGFSQSLDVTLGAQVSSLPSVAPDPILKYEGLEIHQVAAPYAQVCDEMPAIDAVQLERWDGHAWKTVQGSPYVHSPCAQGAYFVGKPGDGKAAPVGSGLTAFLADAHAGDRLTITPSGPSSWLQARLTTTQVQTSPAPDPVSQPFTGPMTWELP